MKMATHRRAAGIPLLVTLFVMMGADNRRVIEPTEENKNPIIGTWVLETLGGETAPTGISVEFTGDGKINVVVKAADGIATSHGTYNIAGAKINIRLKQENGQYKETCEIKKSTRRALVLIKGDGTEETYKRK